MMNLSPALHKRCRDLLLTCAELESYENLRAVFITPELKPFRYGIKKADSQVELVDLFFDYILEQNLTGGIPAFPAFLGALRARYDEGDARRDELNQILNELQAQKSPAPAVLSRPALQHHLLHDKLMTLDFRPQVRRFRDVIQEHKIAAFLVHGPPEHGQRLLTRRLIQWRPEWCTGQRIVIDAGSNGVGKTSRALWRQVAQKLKEPADADRQSLAEKVCEWWKTQNVIFVILSVDYIPPDLLATWLDEFWKPITTAARQQQPSTRGDTHLLLFLVDFVGEVCQSKVTLLDQPEQLRDSHAPLKLPPTEKIKEDELEFWIDNAAEVLPGKVDAITLITATENGIPELLYEKIYASCGLPWEGENLP